MFEFQRVEFDSRAAKKLLDEDPAVDIADGQTIELSNFENVIGGYQAPAHVMFSTTTLGLPGKCLPKYREIALL